MKPETAYRITHEAADLGISIQTMAKRLSNYRMYDKITQQCQKCKHLTLVNFSKRRATQCHEIGVRNDQGADINPAAVCDWYKSKHGG